jgi:hypothetical protein
MSSFKNNVIKVCCLLLFCSAVLSAQNTFTGGFVAGFNASQLNGDMSAGYNKVGLTAGVAARARLAEKSSLAIDMLFSQRGSRTTERESIIDRRVTLNYLEVPVLFNYADWAQESKSGGVYYKVHFGLGLSYGRLFNTKPNFTFSHAGVVDKFRKNDIALVGNLTYFFTKNWGLQWRWTSSLTPVFTPGDYKNDLYASTFAHLRGYFLSFQTVWIF